MRIGQVRETKQVGIGENRSGLPGEIGQDRSELVKTGSKLGQIGRNVPRNTKIPREEEGFEISGARKRHIHLREKGERNRHKTVTTIWCMFDSA